MSMCSPLKLIVKGGKFVVQVPHIMYIVVDFSFPKSLALYEYVIDRYIIAVHFLEHPSYLAVGGSCFPINRFQFYLSVVV